MSDLSIDEFCDLHEACKEGREWALDNCNSIAEAWEKLPADYLVWVATRSGVLTDRELRLFACWCVRQVWHLIDDPRSKAAVGVAERFAIGEAAVEELAAARYAAWAATGSAAGYEAGYAAVGAALESQAAWLRANCNPNFKRTEK